MQLTKALVVLFFAFLAFAALARAEPVPEPDDKKHDGHDNRGNRHDFKRPFVKPKVVPQVRSGAGLQSDARKLTD